MNIAQVLEYKLKFDDLVAEMKEAAKRYEAIFLPACFGLENQEFMESLRKATGLPLFELPTFTAFFIRHASTYSITPSF